MSGRNEKRAPGTGIPGRGRSDPELARLLLRTRAVVLERPDLAETPFSEERWAGLFPGSIVPEFDGMGALGTLGGLARLWENFSGLDCPKCGCRSALFGYGGSLLSGALKYARWFCPECGRTFETVPETALARFVGEATLAARKEPLVTSRVGTSDGSASDRMRPKDLGRVFGGRLLDAYIRLAVAELDALDRDAARRAQRETT